MLPLGAPLPDAVSCCRSCTRGRSSTSHWCRIGIDLTGGSHSDLYLVYLLQCVFMANVSYPRRGRITLTVLTVAAYVAALAGAGWHIGTATLVLRVGMILATAGAADLISVQLTGQLVFRERATAEHEHRASLWSRVAGLGRQLDSLDEDSILAWAVDAVIELGFEAANVCELLDDRRTYRVVHASGAPRLLRRGGPQLRPGHGGPRLEERRTVVVDDYLERTGGLPELRADGFRTVIATPVWVEGELAATLVGGTRTRRAVEDHEIAAFELLAAHAGHGLESARRLEHQRRDAAHFRSLIESAPDAMIVMSTDGVILEANNQVGRLFGYEPDELAGQQRRVPHDAQGPDRPAVTTTTTSSATRAPSSSVTWPTSRACARTAWNSPWRSSWARSRRPRDS